MSTRSRLPRATLEQKITILDYFHASGRPQLDTVEKFKDMVAISTLTFNEWVKRENEYRERYRQLDSKFKKSSRRKSSYKYEKINRAMDAMVQQKLGMNESVTEPMLREYWKMYAHQFGVENPKRLVSFSHGWLSQFKKRHGLLRKKGPKNADLTRATNERLLAEPLQNISDATDYSENELDSSLASEAVEQSKESRRQGRESTELSSQFRPQHTLSFQSQYSYSGRNLPQRRETDKQTSMVVNMGNTPNGLPTATYIEKLLFNVADPFFNEHQYDYPQTVKMYQEFKSSFLSERLIDLRSTKKPKTLVAHSRSDGSSQNEKLLLDHKLLPSSRQYGVVEPPEKRRRLPQQLQQIPQQLSQQLSQQLPLQIPQQLPQHLPQPPIFGQTSSSRLGNSEILDNMFTRRRPNDGFGYPNQTRITQLNGQQQGEQESQANRSSQHERDQEGWNNQRKMWEQNKLLL